MNKEQFNQCIDILKTGYEGFKLNVNENEFWFECLNTYEYRVTSKAISQILREGKEPNIVDITDRCEIVKNFKTDNKSGLPPYEQRSYKNRGPIMPIENPTPAQIEASQKACAKVKEQIKNLSFRSM